MICPYFSAVRNIYFAVGNYQSFKIMVYGDVTVITEYNAVERVIRNLVCSASRNSRSRPEPSARRGLSGLLSEIFYGFFLNR